MFVVTSPSSLVTKRRSSKCPRHLLGCYSTRRWWCSRRPGHTGESCRGGWGVSSYLTHLQRLPSWYCSWGWRGREEGREGGRVIEKWIKRGGREGGREGKERVISPSGLLPTNCWFSPLKLWSSLYKGQGENSKYLIFLARVTPLIFVILDT